MNRRTFFRLVIYSTVFAAASVSYAQSDNLETVRANVPIRGLPHSLDGLTIGIMADFHAGSPGNEEVISKAVTLMQQYKPDIIALLGDYVDGSGSHDARKIGQGVYCISGIIPAQGTSRSIWCPWQP
jgi:predicted MPP superfamily phosphohydrolase